MIIRAYYNWPKLHELKPGNKIRVRKGGLWGVGDDEFVKKWEDKLVTVAFITYSSEIYISIKEWGSTGDCWFVSRFEVKTEE